MMEAAFEKGSAWKITIRAPLNVGPLCAGAPVIKEQLGVFVQSCIKKARGSESAREH